MRRAFRFAALAVLMGVAAGCGTSRNLTTRTELRSIDKPITVYAEDRRVYTLRAHALEDTAIAGFGSVRQGDARSAFRGSIPLTSIRAVRTDSKSVIKGLAVLGVTAMFVAALSEESRHPDGLAVREDKPRIFPQSGGGGGPETSCPYVYSWNGARYVLDAEPFGAALGKGLELTTTHLLPSARGEHGVVRLRLTNERRETHYVNSLSLFAVDLGDAPGAVMDEKGTAWPLARPEAPVRAHDGSGATILGEIADADGRSWECAAARLGPGSGFEDVLELEFVVPHGRSDGTLALTGINTTLSTVVYGTLDRAVADPVTLVHAVDHDPQLIERLREFRNDAALKVSIWNGQAWEAAGSFLPEANAVPFTRALRLRLPRGAGDRVRVRLRSLADVWKIDAVSADWTPASPLPMEPLRLVSALAADGEDLSPSLRSNDEDYAVLVPPDRVELTYADASRGAGRRVVYAVAGRGYLHEWSSEPQATVTGEADTWTPGERRLASVMELMKQREVLLRPVYEEWRTERAAAESRR